MRGREEATAKHGRLKNRWPSPASVKTPGRGLLSSLSLFGIVGVDASDAGGDDPLV